MKRAADDCIARFGVHSFDLCLVDGDRPIDLQVPHHLIVKGDQKSLSIAAASVIAKVHRDNIMKEFGKIHPEYGFAKNKGYKCDDHFVGLDKLGIWVGVHRTSLHPFIKRKGETKEWTLRRRHWVELTEDTLHKGGSHESTRDS